MDKAPPRLLAEADLGETKAKLLDAAFRRLAREGYAALSMREIARDAGVNHALINYHFRSKEQLVIAVLDEANRQLLERQKSMYRSPGGYAEKWAAAREFYKSDLASGFIRMQAELWAASFSNAGLREKFLPRIRAWKQIVVEEVGQALGTLKSRGVVLPAPLTAQVIACWIYEFWLGMEFSDLLADAQDKAPHRAALDAVQTFLEKLDAMALKKHRNASRPKRRKA